MDRLLYKLLVIIQNRNCHIYIYVYIYTDILHNASGGAVGLKTTRRCPTRVFPCAARKACGACDTRCGTDGAAEENSATAVMTHAASIHSLPRLGASAVAHSGAVARNRSRYFSFLNFSRVSSQLKICQIQGGGEKKKDS